MINKAISLIVILLNLSAIAIMFIMPFTVFLLDQPEIPLHLNFGRKNTFYTLLGFSFFILLISSVFIIYGRIRSKKIQTIGFILSALFFTLIYFCIPDYHITSKRSFSENNQHGMIQIREYTNGEKRYYKWNDNNSNYIFKSKWDLDSTSVIKN